MNISIDGGALCADQNHRYGNYRFSYDFLTALSRYDTDNKYKIYTFCENRIRSETAQFEYKHITPSSGFMPYRVGVEEFMFGGQVFLALNQAIPTYTKGKIITFSHGLSYYFYPKLYPDIYKTLTNQLGEMIKRSDIIVVSSQKVKSEMKLVAPNFDRVVVLPFGVPPEMQSINEIRVKEKYFLYVGMDHPIKQIDKLVEMFLSARERSGNKEWQLKLVGVGTEYKDINSAIQVVSNATHSELIKIYQKASCLLTASLYESFNYPVLEALLCHTPVIGLESAIIPEMKDYVSVAKKVTEFENLLVGAMRGDAVPRKKLNKQDFSWENYVKKLIELY